MHLADDNAIGRSTCYDYLHEGIEVLASQAPERSYALQTAKTAGQVQAQYDGASSAGGPGCADYGWTGAGQCAW